MSTMQFISELAEYLRQHGYIYTVRAYCYNSFNSEIDVPTVGRCRRELIASFDEHMFSLLEDYVVDSGFANLEAWISKIRYFIPSGKGMYLYKVERFK